MTQNKIECDGWRVPRARTAHCGRRPVVCGYDAFNRAVAENSRARLIADIISPTVRNPKNEFASCFYGSQNNSPKESMMSHSTRSPERKRRPIIPSYPSLMALRFNPQVEISSVDNSRTEVTNDHKFHCKCKSCRMKNCQAKNSSSSTLKTTLKGNIMTFSDKDTMTPRLKDAFCATRSVSGSPNTSDASVVAASPCRDLRNGIPLNYHIDEGTIVTKENIFKCERCGFIKDNNVEVIHKPERDVCHAYKECNKTSSVKSIFKFKRREQCTEMDPPRRTIYNEGINDIIARRCPVSSKVIPPKIDLSTTGSRVSLESKTIPKKFNIPFSHTNQSRYHDTCRKSASRLRFEDDDDLKQLVGSPDGLKRCYAHKPMRHPKLPYIKLPRRVLTSERDIESYVDKTSTNCGKRKKKERT